MFEDDFRLIQDEEKPAQKEATIPTNMIGWLIENNCSVTFEAYSMNCYGYSIQKNPPVSVEEDMLAISPSFQEQADLISWWQANQKELSYKLNEVYPKVFTENGVVFEVNYSAISKIYKWIKTF